MNLIAQIPTVQIQPQVQVQPINNPSPSLNFDPAAAFWLALAGGFGAFITRFIPLAVKSANFDKRLDARLKERQTEIARTQSQVTADIDITTALSKTVSGLAQQSIENSKESAHEMMIMLKESMEGKQLLIEASLHQQKASENIANASADLVKAFGILSVGVEQNNQAQEKAQKLTESFQERITKGQADVRSDISVCASTIIERIDTVIKKQHDLDDLVRKLRADILSADSLALNEHSDHKIIAGIVKI